MKPALAVLFSFLTLTLTAVAADEAGLASWYGEPYHGRVAASGEVYNMEELTAAHRTLPFNTSVRVNRLDTGASVVVRINDRGPIPDDRIIDLSKAAARRLGMIEPGLVPVALQVVKPVSSISRMVYAVQVGAFRVRQNAERALPAMVRYGTVRMVFRSETNCWTVVVGDAETRAEAESVADRIRENPRLGTAFVVRIEFADGASAE
ncbi:MAG TPA: septal ring lytic transglycosylase RlpA family protein [Bryobacteraceae bacterium]|jgi:rare lipoprotein A|nr:septal ring lytic transglycosylase RlpA family protein [Bryobacteraceae bacterium]